MNFEIITAPLIGAAIGTITNGIAIKMLFRPWNPVYIGKFKLPFTPGLIPKEKPRIAASIAKVIGNNLLDDDTIKDISTQKRNAHLNKIELQSNDNFKIGFDKINFNKNFYSISNIFKTINDPNYKSLIASDENFTIHDIENEIY